jgi:hypothetical protein
MVVESFAVVVIISWRQIYVCFIVMFFYSKERLLCCNVVVAECRGLLFDGKC